MFDAHRHLPRFASRYEDALYCTSRTDEWESLSALCPPASGAAGALASSQLPQTEALHRFLVAHPTCQVGEIGLDRRFGDMEKQEAFFRAATDLAFEMGRSLTIHVVRSDGRALRLLEAAGSRRPPILWHGFTGSRETGYAAARLGCIISIGPTILHTKTGRNLPELRTLPLAVETDYDKADERSYRQVLHRHYLTVARLLDMEVDALVRKGYECRSILTDNPVPRPGCGGSTP